MEKTLVFIDSGYLWKINLHLGNGTPYKLELHQFAITLSRAVGLWCDGVYLYTGSPYQSPTPTPDEIERKRRHDRFISRVSKIPNFVVRAGRCQKTDDGYQQKAVDTLLTMDLMKVPLRRKDIKQIIILACDTDFVPVLNELRTEGIGVILAYYTDRMRGSKFSMSNHIFTACDKKILLTKEHFEKSLHNPNKKNTNNSN